MRARHLAARGAGRAAAAARGRVRAIAPVGRLRFAPIVASVPAPGPTGIGSPLLPGQQLVGWMQYVHAWVQARPWVLALAALGVLGASAAAQVAIAGLLRWRQRRSSTHAQQILLVPPPVVDPGGAGLWWANVAGLLRQRPWRRLVEGAAHIGLEYRWSGRQMQIVVWVPGTVAAQAVAAAARAAWPGASTRIEPAGAPLLAPATGTGSPPAAPGSRGREAGAALVPALPAWSPLATAGEHKVDPLRALVAGGAQLRPREQACVQVLARPAGARRVARATAGALALRTGAPGGRSPGEQVVVGALRALTDLLTPGSGPARRLPPAPAGAHPLRERDARTGLDKLSG